MDNSKPVTMWAAQHRRVMDTLRRDGIYYVKNSYIEEKYGETAWVFKEAYRFINKRAAGMVKQPEEGESLIWLFADAKWTVPEHETVVMRLSIPESELVLFDSRRWNKVLNLSYIGSAEQEQKFEDGLSRIGINDPLDLFSKPFYPIQKKQVIDSWEQIFEIDNTPKEYLQAGAWRLKEEWIQDIID